MLSIFYSIVYSIQWNILFNANNNIYKILSSKLNMKIKWPMWSYVYDIVSWQELRCSRCESFSMAIRYHWALVLSLGNLHLMSLLPFPEMFSWTSLHWVRKQVTQALPMRHTCTKLQVGSWDTKRHALTALHSGTDTQFPEGAATLSPVVMKGSSSNHFFRMIWGIIHFLTS